MLGKEMLGPGIFSKMTWHSSGEVQHDLLEASSDNSPPELDFDIQLNPTLTDFKGLINLFLIDGFLL